MNMIEGKTRRTFTAKLFRDDMGSYTTNCHSWEDLLWHVNSARDYAAYIVRACNNAQRLADALTDIVYGSDPIPRAREALADWRLAQ